MGRGVQPLEGGAGASEEGLSRELYELLLRPAEGLLVPADRLVILPDGPLHTLPFAALRRAEGGSARHLLEWKPLHVAVSATVYAELKKGRRAVKAEGLRIAAFGDPRYPSVTREQAEKLTNPDVRAVVRRGAALSPLPFTREEVQTIAGLYPTTSRTYLGEEATEGRAKGVGKDAQVLHFACHGLVDERFPLNSALALTIPESPKEGEENGLLQAWEIFDGLRIEAELVTLSACETGLGKEFGGEGLVGLTRAFQYAGARSVLASLWSVGDSSTSELMKGFYGGLKAGKSKDEALRGAQLKLLKDERTASPFHWAAFQIYGDWR
jgi:CHAT domain-containing protein